jgi:hypothetical protein
MGARLDPDGVPELRLVSDPLPAAGRDAAPGEDTGRIVAIAAGTAAATAIAGLLAAGRLDGLITDEGTARAILHGARRRRAAAATGRVHA